MVSKQITFVDYDDRNEVMTVYYHTGQIRKFASVSNKDYLYFLHSSNKYDCLVELASKNRERR